MSSAEDLSDLFCVQSVVLLTRLGGPFELKKTGLGVFFRNAPMQLLAIDYALLAIRSREIEVSMRQYGWSLRRWP